MTQNRRDFLLGTAALATGAAIGLSSTGTASAAEAKSASKADKAELKIGSQLGRIPGSSTEEKLARMVEWGYVGVELGGDIVGKEDYYIKATKDAGIPISAICYGSLKGDIVSEDESKRGPAIEQLKEVLTSAGAIGSTGVIYVPAFNGQTKLTNQEIRKILLDVMPEIGEHALKAGTRLLFEPLNRGEAYFLRQVADGAAIARDCKSEGICVMGDFYHMNIEETSDMGAFISAGDMLHHVHLASRTRKLPGQDERSFVDGFRGLKYIGYSDFCSLECGVIGDPMVEIPKVVPFLKDQWEQAVI